MTKTHFLNRLSEALEDSTIASHEHAGILEDYTAMIDDAKHDRPDLEVFIQALGTPEKIVRELEKTMGEDHPFSDKLTALSPFVALILFFLLGFGLNAWHPGWLVFLLIPITAISTSEKGVDRLGPLSVFAALIAFMLIGTYTNLWHPFWALFLIIPATVTLTKRNASFGPIAFHTASASQREPRPNLWLSYAYYTYLSILLYILGVLLWEINPYLLGLLFLPVVIVPLIDTLQHNLQAWHALSHPQRTHILILIGFTVLLSTGTVLFGLTSNVWHPTWVVFMLIPLAVLSTQKWVFKSKIESVAFTPFIAVILFFVIGDVFDLYHLSWLVFLIIPITGILFSNDT